MRPVSQRKNVMAAGLCGIGALVLFASMFLHWYPVLEGAYFDRSVGAPANGSFTAGVWLNAWESFAVVDLALAACVATGLWSAATLLRRGPHRVTGYTAIAAGAIGLGLVVWRIVDQPFELGEGGGVGVGAVIAVAALLTIAFGGALSIAEVRA
jgi:hypothetical protein